MKLREIYVKHKEIILYLIFGVMTTVVSWITYFAVMYGGRAVFSIPADDVSGADYLAVYTASQVISWIAAVLFAFATNRKWVFTDADRDAPVMRQLAVFASGRLLTLGLDFVITYAGTLALSSVLPETVLGVNPSEVISKLAAAFVVIVCNYIFSKLFVFSRAKKANDGAGAKFE